MRSIKNAKLFSSVCIYVNAHIQEPCLVKNNLEHLGLEYPVHIGTIHLNWDDLSNSYTMGCPPVRGDNPRALASGLSYVQVDKHSMTILYHLHQCRPCTSQDISCSSWQGWYNETAFAVITPT